MSEQKMSPLFSVIIPTLGKTDIWLEAIRSVREQTYTDWEIIAVDSGPESVSRPLVESLGDPRIIYINTEAGNPKLNWDTGYRHAQGKYMVWLDDDNYMLPHLLSTLQQLIEKNPRVDFVTSNHMHWNDLHHPIVGIRNHLVIPKRLYSGEVIAIDPRNAVKKLFTLPYDGEKIYARFHHTCQGIRKEVVDSYTSKIGKIDFGSTSSHALRIGMLALSKSVLFADVPTALIAQSGNSLSMVWPNQSSAIKQKPYEYTLSEVRANTYINYVHENHLLLKKYLPDELKDFTLPQAQFLRAHIWSLIFLKLSWSDFSVYWKEVRGIIAHSQDPRVQALSGVATKFYMYAVGIKILRMFGLYSLAQALFSFKRMGGKAKYEQILIDISSYGAQSMQGVASILPQAIERYFKTSYKTFMRLESLR